ncbi:hypothetical protein AAVH_09271 [Aphelenchoides avenae]|nr:hypothetical protein AAVH_09271 [Aphelenchus avenae]
MDVPQQIYAVSCNRGWRLTWNFRQADVTWFCDVTLQTERTEYALSARGRNKKVARASAAYELASRLVEDGVLDIIEVMDWKADDHVKAATKPDMSAGADISVQLQALTEFVRKQTEMYSTVVKSQAELIARLGKAVQDSDRRIDLLHSELRGFFEWITNGEFVPADTIQSKKPDVDEDGQYEPHEKPIYDDVIEAALETDLSVLCLGSPRSIETEPDVGESDPPELEGWLHDEAEERETLVSSMPRRQSSRVTYELLGPTEIGWNNGDNESDFPRGFAEDPVVRMGSGTSWANTVNTSVEPEHRTTQRTMSGGASVVTGPSNGYGIPDRKEQDFPAYNYDAPSGTKKFGVQGTPPCTASLDLQVVKDQPQSTKRNGSQNVMSDSKLQPVTTCAVKVLAAIVKA